MKGRVNKEKCISIARSAGSGIGKGSDVSEEPRYTVAEVLAMLCTTCRWELAKPGLKTCQKCLDKAAQRQGRDLSLSPIDSFRNTEKAYLDRMLADLGIEENEDV